METTTTETKAAVKISAGKTSRLYVVARFESFKVCDFSAAMADCVNDLVYARRLSAADAKLNRFYLVVSNTGMTCVYRDGVQEGILVPSELVYASHKTLNARFPLPSE